MAKKGKISNPHPSQALSGQNCPCLKSFYCISVLSPITYLPENN